MRQRVGGRRRGEDAFRLIDCEESELLGPGPSQGESASRKEALRLLSPLGQPLRSCLCRRLIPTRAHSSLKNGRRAASILGLITWRRETSHPSVDCGPQTLSWLIGGLALNPIQSPAHPTAEAGVCQAPPPT